MAKRIPNITIDTRNSDEKLLKKLEPAFLSLDAKIKILGTGANSFEHCFSLEEAIEETDIWLFLSASISRDFGLVVKKGIVPVVMTGIYKKAENYDPVNERGNVFTFTQPDPWQIYGALLRSVENYAFPYDWQNLKSNAKTLV